MDRRRPVASLCSVPMAFICMSRRPTDNVQELDRLWMAWLRTCSRRKGVSDATLLQEYAQSKEDWYRSVEKLRTEKADDWVFCRGQLSDTEMTSARERYLSRFVFVAGDQCSTSFVDAIMAIEDAQIRLRLDMSTFQVCAECLQRDSEIAMLRAALSARELCDNTDVRAAAVRSIFQRYFVIGESYGMCRNSVRRTIERVMRIEFGPHERLTHRCDVWRRFLFDVMGTELSSAKALPCRPRVPPLTVAEFDAESSAGS